MLEFHQDIISKKVASMDLSDSNSVFPFLDLPQTVRNRVLNQLSIWNLMDMRLVCQTTKSWVDKDHLYKFVLYIKNYGQMEDIVFKSDTAWSNLLIQSDANLVDQSWIHNPLYSGLLQKLTTSLSSLKMENHRLPQSGLISILSTCQALKNINIGTLDCKEWTVLNDVTIQNNLKQLKNLSIGYLSWSEDQDLDLFKCIISQCTNLVYLKAPHILMANLFQIGDTDDEEVDRKYLELVDRKLVRPIIDFLKNDSSHCDKLSNKSKCFKTLDVENLHHSEIFPAIVSACYETNTRLLNVSEAFEHSIPASQSHFQEVIESLNGFTRYLNFHKLVNLKSIVLDSETSADSEIQDESINAQLPALKSISMCLPGDIDQSILNCFLKQRRTSVTSFNIEFQVTNEPKLFVLFKASDLVRNFDNLQHLALLDWNGKDDDLIVILNGLTGLRSLRLQGCDKITDRGFLGENPADPLLLKVKDLNMLWMDCQISNAVLKYAVRHLKLEILFFFSQRITVPGFLSLTQGPLTTTLIVFQVTEPADCTEEMLEKFMSCFKNIKRGPLSFCSRCRVHLRKCTCDIKSASSIMIQ